MRSLLAVVAVGLLLGADDPKDNPAKKEQAKLEGTWKATSLEVRGQAEPEDQVKDIKFTFKGDKVTVESRDPKREMTYTLDPAKEPKTIDLTRDDKKETSLGIYELDGDTLKIAFIKPGKDRPTKFESGGDTRLLVLKRQKE